MDQADRRDGGHDDGCRTGVYVKVQADDDRINQQQGQPPEECPPNLNAPALTGVCVTVPLPYRWLICPCKATE